MGPPSVMEQIKRTNVEIKIIPENHTVETGKSKVSKIIGADSDELIDAYLNPKIKKLEQQTNLKDKKKIIYILGMQRSPLIAGTSGINQYFWRYKSTCLI